MGISLIRQLCSSLVVSCRIKFSELRCRVVPIAWSNSVFVWRWQFTRESWLRRARHRLSPELYVTYAVTLCSLPFFHIWCEVGDLSGWSAWIYL